MIFQYAHADNKQDLQSIRQSIQAQEQKLAEQKKQRVALYNELQRQEKMIANLLSQLDKTDSTLNGLKTDIAQLTPAIESLELEQKAQQKVLSKQLESAFKFGKTSSMELIFNANDSERNERMITYFGYINEALQQKIETLRNTEAELNQKVEQLTQKHQQQKEFQAKQQEQHNNLLISRNTRQKTIDQLDKSMTINQQNLEELKINERELQQQIATAEAKNKQIAQEEEKQARQIEVKQTKYNYQPTISEKSLMARVSGIGKPQNNLKWPVSGTLAHQFGEPLQGELRWKGLVIQAKEGTKVKAIAEGRVILASWLQGYGFIVAIDHGRGDMSLYGYNQRLLVDVGDKIKTGQDIALVGSTGGQKTPSLYFEIRRDGKALNPSAWLKK